MIEQREFDETFAALSVTFHTLFASGVSTVTITGAAAKMIGVVLGALPDDHATEARASVLKIIDTNARMVRRQVPR